VSKKAAASSRDACSSSGEVPVAVVRVGEGVVEHRRQQDPGEPAVGPVEDVEPDLLLDHVHLVAQVLLRQLGGAQAVGLQEQRALQRRGREHLEVVGVVLVRRAVEHAAGALDVPEVRELLQALAALEHQVLEQVREPGAPLRLGAEAHVDVHGDADDGGGGVRDDEDPQPVGQRRPMQFWRRHAAECIPLRGPAAYPGSAPSRPVPGRQSTYSNNASPSATTDTSW
jgi:hypothetical protein